MGNIFSRKKRSRSRQKKKTIEENRTFPTRKPLPQQKGPLSPTVFLLPPPPSMISPRTSLQPRRAQLTHQSSGEVIYFRTLSSSPKQRSALSLSPSASPASIYSNVGQYENWRSDSFGSVAAYENTGRPFTDQNSLKRSMGNVFSRKKCSSSRQTMKTVEESHTFPTRKPLPQQKGPLSPTVFLLPPPSSMMLSRTFQPRRAQPAHSSAGDALYSRTLPPSPKPRSALSLSPSASPASIYSNVGQYENWRSDSFGSVAAYENTARPFACVCRYHQYC